MNGRDYAPNSFRKDPMYKTTPYAHQVACLAKFGRARAFALLADMGTGKSWIIINNAADLWRHGLCDSVLIFAPNGVQTNWTRLELPAHMPDDIRWRAAAWSSTNAKAERAMVEAVTQPSATGELRILTMNWEALTTARGRKTVDAFCGRTKSLMIVCDESDEIKNPAAQRTKALMRLRPYSVWRRILTGTPIDGTPFSAFSQFAFLDPAILGTTSYTAFKATYAEMLQAGNPLLTAIIKKGNLRFAPQIVATGPGGRPRYRNLDELRRLIAPHTFRVLKTECLDLPPKVYTTVYFDLTAEQAAIYAKAEEELRLSFEGEDTPFNRLAIATKLSQITSGYYLHPNSPDPVRIPGETPKLDAMAARVTAIVAAGGKVIVWARYTVEIEDITRVLAATGLSLVTYYGLTKKEARDAAIEAFERGTAQVFIGNQQAGGTGITLVAASVVMYFSNNFRLRDRLQSEDRAHRIGQTKAVTYLNLVAKDTIDEAVVRALMNKKDVADCIVDGTLFQGGRQC